MLCSLLRSMCPSANICTDNAYSFPSKYSPLPSPLQEHSPPQSPSRTFAMTSDCPNSSSPTSPTSTMSIPMSSSITPPGSPPSPTMSMGSIHGHPLQLDLALQQTSCKLKVMIVDDNSINLAILSRMIQVHFAETVHLASIMTSGVAALETLSKEEFDLILMDIDMPVLTGVETTCAIRQPTEERPILHHNQNVPIIAVTTSDGQAQQELYQQVGMSDCVSKPIALPKLRSAIEGTMKTTGRLAAG